MEWVSISLDFSPPDRPIIPVFLHQMLQQNSSRVTLSGVDKAGCGIKKYAGCISETVQETRT